MHESLEETTLIKPVAGHLFSFQEKMFGMSLPHLLTDLGVLCGSFSLLASLPVVPRVTLCALCTLLTMVLVHGSIGGRALIMWFFLLLRFRSMPTRTIWHSTEQPGQPNSVQASWVPIDSITCGIAQSQRKGSVVRYQMALEIEGRNIDLLPEEERIRAFRHFETFLCGLQFHVQLLSFSEPIDTRDSPAFRAQKEALPRLAHLPHLCAFHRANLGVQERQLRQCSSTRHFVIICASTADPALRSSDDQDHSWLSVLLHLWQVQHTGGGTPTQALDLLHTRKALVQQALARVGLRAAPLDDRGLLQLLAQMLAPGVPPPTFVAEPRQGTGKRDQVLRGVHGMFLYRDTSAFDPSRRGGIAIADLLAPSSVTVLPDSVQIQVGTTSRFVRSFVVTGYGHHLTCGWMQRLHDLGLPLVTSTHIEPIDSRLMTMRLERELTRLESKRLSDQKTLRIMRADQAIESEQIRLITRALAEKRLKIFDVTMTICIHAGTRAHLEQRSRILLSHLRDMQIRAYQARYQQDLAWQSCLPVGLDRVQHWIKLTSDVVSTMLPGTSASVGTPTGVLLGHVGDNAARRPVYLHPWSPDKKLLNPHIVVVGETGAGKTHAGLTLVTGLLELGIADVCVLDRADDYLRLHEHLPGESQRYSFARRCPINLFDLPFGPHEVDSDDRADMLAEFFHNMLIHGLTILLCDENEKLSKSEEAYLMNVARATYATCGITSEAIRQNPEITLREPPTLEDFLSVLKSRQNTSISTQQSLLERLEMASYLFEGGQTSVSLHTPLTIFSTKGLDARLYPLMMYATQTFLMRHRALKEDQRYMSFVVEEASYLLKHPACRKTLEYASREFRKSGMQLITVSQDPNDFLQDGQVILANAATAMFLSMEPTAARLLNLPEELEQHLTQKIPGHCVLRIGSEHAALRVWPNPVYRSIFTTDPVEKRIIGVSTNGAKPILA